MKQFFSKNWLFGIALFLPCFLQAQIDSSQMTKHKKSLALGFSSGSNAIVGIDVAMKVAPKITVRLGYNYLDYTFANVVKYITISALDPVRDKVKAEAKIAQSSVSLLGDFNLTKNGVVRATLGGFYAFKNTYSGTIAYAQSESYNDITITPDQIGYIKGDITTKSKLNPYIGIGFGNLVPKKRASLSLDLGTIYRGSPIVNIEATQLLRGNSENAAPLTRNLAPYKWYPIGSLRLTVKLF
jgi:hypothetical protein